MATLFAETTELEMIVLPAVTSEGDDDAVSDDEDKEPEGDELDEDLDEAEDEDEDGEEGAE